MSNRHSVQKTTTTTTTSTRCCIMKIIVVAMINTHSGEDREREGEKCKNLKSEKKYTESGRERGRLRAARGTCN